MSSIKIPFLDIKAGYLELKEEFDSAYHRVMDSGLVILGKETEAFENEFAAYCNSKHCLLVANGLDALQIVLRAWDIGPGDEVIVPSNTFIATWLAVSNLGAIPVPVEPNPDTYNIDIELIESSISQKTKAIIPVHLYGQPADMDPILELADKHGLKVLEDNAQAQGALYKCQRTGGLGHAAATSFYPGKNLGAFGDSGAITTNDDQLADAVRHIRNYGSTVKYSHDLIGVNSRSDELQAAFLRIKLRRLDEWNSRREKLAEVYNSLLNEADVKTPVISEQMKSVWHLYVIRSRFRSEIQKILLDSGIVTGIHYPKPPHKQKCYIPFKSMSLKISEKLSREVLSLPMSPFLDANDASYIAELICSYSQNRM
jgi:dTDP-4-amino-4,6-dideoxygalactose transaminase